MIFGYFVGNVYLLLRYGIHAGVFGLPADCQLLDGTCEVHFVKKNDTSQPCFVTHASTTTTAPTTTTTEDTSAATEEYTSPVTEYDNQLEKITQQLQQITHQLQKIIHKLQNIITWAAA